MGIFDRLFGGRFTQPPPDEPPLSDATIMRELHPFRAELKAFTEHLLQRTPEKERARLVRRVMRSYGQGEDPVSALTEGVLDPDKGQSLEHLVLLAIDWKGSCSFEYLAPFLIRASGVQEEYPFKPDSTIPVVQILIEFDQWLAGYGKRYLHLNTGGDEYVGCVVDADRVERVIEMAGQAEIEARLDAF